MLARFIVPAGWPFWATMLLFWGGIVGLVLIFAVYTRVTTGSWPGKQDDERRAR